MANYNVDISVAIKNTNKLTAFNKQLDKTAKTAERARKGLGEIGQTAKTNIATLNNLSAALSKAKSEFRDTVLGTKASVLAARDLATAERKVNKELKERTALMNKFRFQGGGSAFKSFSQSASQIQSPNVLTTAQQKSINRQNIKQGRNPVPFGPQQFIGPLPMQGPMFGPMQGPMAGPKQMLGPGNFKGRILANLGQSKLEREIAAAGSNRVGFGGGFKAFSKSADKIAAGVKANVKQTTKTASILSQQATRAAFEGMPFGAKGGQIGPPPPPTFFNKMGFGANAKKTGPFAMPGGPMGRLKGGAGSALIGGGFPFLFGAGGLSAAMGAGAGALGGALAPGGGFALSIAATAAAAQIEDAIKFRKELKKLNAQITAIGGSSEFSRKEIKNLGKELNLTKEEVIEALDAFLPRFEKESIAEMLLKTLGTPEQFDALAGITDSSSLINEIVKSRDIIGQTKADELLADLKLGDSLEVQLKLTKEIADVRRKQLLKTQAEELKISDKNFKKLINEEGNLKRFLAELDPNSKLGKLFKDVDPNTEFFSELSRQVGFGTLGRNLQLFKKEFFGMLNEKELAKFDEAAEKTAKLVEFGREYALQLQEFEEFRAPVDEIERLSRATRVVLDVSRELKTSFAESFKGIVKGTMTVTDAFRNMLNRIGDYFLDLAAQVLAAGIQKSFLGLFQNMFNIQMPISGMADGGRVTGGRPYIVGERGPELFTPGVGGSITPNESLGGSTNIVVNVDASGSNVEGDEDEGRALGIALSTAIETELIKQKRPGGLLA